MSNSVLWDPGMGPVLILFRRESGFGLGVECLDCTALLAVCLRVVKQTTCYKSFDRYDVSVCTGVCIQETMDEGEKETKILGS